MTKDEKDQGSIEFMLKEYDHHLKEFERSEEIGEHRVNFFITLVTAVSGALGVFLFKCDKFDVREKTANLILISAFLALLIFGFLTLVRIVHRNLISHKELRAMGRIRRYFVEKDPEINKYLQYSPRDDKPIRMKKWREIASIGTGGLVETTMLVNAFLTAVLAVQIYNYFVRSIDFIIIAGISGFLLAWTLQFVFVKLRYDRGRPKRSEIRYPSDFKGGT